MILEYHSTILEVRTNAEKCMIVIADKHLLYNAVTAKNGNLIWKPRTLNKLNLIKINEFSRLLKQALPFSFNPQSLRASSVWTFGKGKEQAIRKLQKYYLHAAKEVLVVE